MNNENPKLTGPDRQATTRIERKFISKSEARRIEVQSRSEPEPTTDSLMSKLPKDPEELTRDELLQRFQELAMRCFNSENRLSMAMELVVNYEKIIKEQWEDIREILDAVETQTRSVEWAVVEILKLKYPEPIDRIYGEMH